MTDLSVAGRHFMLGLQKSPRLTDHDKALLEELSPPAVILFAPNFDHEAAYPAWLETAARLIEDVRTRTGRDKLIVAIDHEGGHVVRPPAPITRFAAPRHWADKAAEVSRAMATELRSIGVNMDFFPLLDVDSNPANPVIGERAFATDPAGVFKAARAAADAMEAEGVLTCAKHFPGHGDTEIDSHHGLPSVKGSLAELHGRELKPFGAFIKTGCSLIMTAHVVFPDIDPQWPATLSRTIMHDILRGELGYTGVAVTDDIGMRAIRSYYDVPGASAQTINAGCDMIMVCAHWTDTGIARTLAQDLSRSIAEGAVSENVLVTSAARIDALVDRAQTFKPEVLSEDVFAAHARLAPLHREGRDRIGRVTDAE